MGMLGKEKTGDVQNKPSGFMVTKSHREKSGYVVKYRD